MIMNKPTVLIVDDRADDERGKLIVWENAFELRILHPQDVTSDDLQIANVVVVDFRLDDSWPERDERTTISLQPNNGLALAGVLKSHERSLDGSPTAFVLRSAHLDDLSPEFPPDARLHVIARQNNLEWVLNKNADINLQLNQISSLAEAIDNLPEVWPTDNPISSAEILQGWLALPGLRWQELAWQDIEDCHPPLHELSERKHGLRLIRWLGQRIFPYPCFLWTAARLATRLKVTHASLGMAFKSGLTELFEPAKYVGAMQGFDGHIRWWSRGLETILWDVMEGRSFDSNDTIHLLNERCGNKLVPLEMSQPVLCVTKDFQFRYEPCDIAEAVRVQPDDWPAFAEQAWAALEDVHEDERLASVVIAADRDGGSTSEDVRAQ